MTAQARKWIRDVRSAGWRCEFAAMCAVMFFLAAPVQGGERAGAAAGSPQITGAPELRVVGPARPLYPGSAFEIEFQVGTATDPVQGLFGISFELRYSSAEFLQISDPVALQAGDFLLPDVYTFVRHEPENGVMYLAVSRKRGASGRYGNGVVLKLPLRFANNAPAGWQVCFEVSGITANDSLGNRIEVAPGPALCLRVAEPRIEVTPNPFTPNGDDHNDRTRFRRDGGLPHDWVILIMDRAGRVIRRLRNGNDTWDGRDEEGRLVLPGAYLYVIRKDTRLMRRGVIGVIR